MQGLTDGPRAGLTAGQVTRLLFDAPAVEVGAGLDLLDSTLTVVDSTALDGTTLTDDLVGGSVERVMLADIHGTCSLRLNRQLEWGNVLVRPFQTLSAEGVTARFDLGVFCLATPDTVYGASVKTYEVKGYDRLYLLNRAIGDAYSISAGVSYLTAIGNTLVAAGIPEGTFVLQGDAAGSVLPSPRVWPFIDANGTIGQTTWLRVINDLLAAVGYRGLFADPSTGVLRGVPYVNPISRTPEATLGASGVRAVVQAERTEVLDLFKAPNKWVFVQQNRPVGGPAPVEGAGIYTVVNQSAGPSSVDARGGLMWVSTVPLDAADQAGLTRQGDIRVASDQRATRTLTITTTPFPIVGHADVVTYDDPERGEPLTCQGARWEIDLAGGAVSWQLEAVA